MINPVAVEIKRLMDVLENTTPGSEKYDQVLEEIQVLAGVSKTLESQEKRTPLEKFVSNPALIGSATTIVATLMVLIFERSDSITTRAFSWIRPH